MKTLTQKELLTAITKMLKDRICYNKVGDRGTVLKRSNVTGCALVKPYNGSQVIRQTLEDGTDVSFIVMIKAPAKKKVAKK